MSVITSCLPMCHPRPLVLLQVIHLWRWVCTASWLRVLVLDRGCLPSRELGGTHQPFHAYTNTHTHKHTTHTRTHARTHTLHACLKAAWLSRRATAELQSSRHWRCSVGWWSRGLGNTTPHPLATPPTPPLTMNPTNTSGCRKCHLSLN